MNSYYCPECVVNWYPLQAIDGCCPDCKRGTVMRQEPASPEAVERWQQACAGENTQPTEPLDTLELLYALPAFPDLKRRAA